MGDTIIEEGGEGTEMFFLIRGVVEVSICLSVHLSVCSWLFFTTFVYITGVVEVSVHLYIHLCVHSSVHLSMFLALFITSVYVTSGGVEEWWRSSTDIAGIVEFSYGLQSLCITVCIPYLDL